MSYGNPINQSDHVLHMVGIDNKSFREKRNQNQTGPKQISEIENQSSNNPKCLENELKPKNWSPAKQESARLENLAV